MILRIRVATAALGDFFREIYSGEIYFGNSS
jgi:hypothetical protein